jgi:transposase-like protein
MNKYRVKCPKCQSTEIWKVGFVPTIKGRKDRFKCTRCAHTFYKGQPGTAAVKVGAERKPRVKKKKAG